MSQKRQVDKRWISRKSIRIQFHNGMCINDNEMITIIDRNIHKYNTHKNEWSQVVKCPRYFLKYRGLLFFDTTSKQLLSAHYVYRKHHSHELVLTMYDIENNKCNPKRYGPSVTNLAGIVPYLCHVDGNIHIIGGQVFAPHYVWNFNHKRNIYKLIHNFKFERGNLMYISLVHVSSKQMILMIGGSDSCYYHNNDRYDEEHKKRRIGIWKFCLILQKWAKLQFIGPDFKQANVRCVLSLNEDFVIIAGGWDRNLEKSDEIFVLDLRDDNHYKLKKSQIKCPQKGICDLVRFGGGIQDELLVIGWIKDLFKTTDFKHLSLPPMYLMKMIQSWYNQEMIHWLQKNEHYAIKLKYILS